MMNCILSDSFSFFFHYRNLVNADFIYFCRYVIRNFKKPQTNSIVNFITLGLWLFSLISGKPLKDDRCISTQCEIHQHKCMFGNLLISSMSYFCLVH